MREAPQPAVVFPDQNPDQEITYLLEKKAPTLEDLTQTPFWSSKHPHHGEYDVEIMVEYVRGLSLDAVSMSNLVDAFEEGVHTEKINIWFVAVLLGRKVSHESEVETIMQELDLVAQVELFRHRDFLIRGIWGADLQKAVDHCLLEFMQRSSNYYLREAGRLSLVPGPDVGERYSGEHLPAPLSVGVLEADIPHRVLLPDTEKVRSLLQDFERARTAIPDTFDSFENGDMVAIANYLQKIRQLAGVVDQIGADLNRYALDTKDLIAVYQDVFRVSDDYASDFHVEFQQRVLSPLLREVLDDLAGHCMQQLTLFERFALTEEVAYFSDSEAQHSRELVDLFGVPYLQVMALHKFFPPEQHIVEGLYQVRNSTATREVIEAIASISREAQAEIGFATPGKGLVEVARAKFARALRALQLYMDRPNQPEQVLEELRLINLELAVELAHYRSEGSVNESNYHVCAPEQVSDSARRVIFDQYQKAWIGKSPEVWQSLERDLRLGFEDKDTGSRMYLYGDKDAPSAFVRFQDKEDGRVYVSALVVAPGMQQAGLASYAYETAFDVEAQNAIVVGKCEPRELNNTRYFEKGFVGTQKIHVHDVEALTIVRNEDYNQRLEGKHMSKKELIEKTPSELGKLGMVRQEFPDLATTTYDFLATHPGYGLVRSFQHPSRDRWVLVYEELPAHYATGSAAEKDTSNR